MSLSQRASSDPDYYAADIGYQVIAVCVSSLVVVLILLLLRLIAQSIAGRRAGFDDYFLWLGILTIVALNGISMALPTIAGVGRHLEIILETHPEELNTLFIYLIPGQVLYITSFTCTKISLLGLYLRIFITKVSRRLVYALIAITAATWIALVPVVFVQCVPLEAYWNRLYPEQATCINISRFLQFLSFPNIVTDVAMLFLPVPTIWRIQITTTQKVGLAFSFLLGSVGLVAAVARFVVFSITDAGDDATWSVVQLLIWSVTEASMYAAAACLPTLRPLLHEIRRRMGWSQSSSAQRSNIVPSRKARTDVELSRLERRQMQRLDDDEPRNFTPLGSIVVGGSDGRQYGSGLSDSWDDGQWPERGILQTHQITITRE